MSLPVRLDHCVIHVSDWDRERGRLMRAKG